MPLWVQMGTLIVSVSNISVPLAQLRYLLRTEWSVVWPWYLSWRVWRVCSMYCSSGGCCISDLHAVERLLRIPCHDVIECILRMPKRPQITTRVQVATRRVARDKNTRPCAFFGPAVARTDLAIEPPLTLLLTSSDQRPYGRTVVGALSAMADDPHTLSRLVLFSITHSCI